MHTKRGRYFRASLTAIFLSCISLSALASEKQASESKVAVVNGSVITQKDLNRELSVVQQQFLRQGKSLSDSQLLEMKKNVLENLINVELLYQEAQSQGTKVDDEAINKQLGTVKARFPNEDEFKGALSKMNLSEADLRSQINRGLSIQQFIDKKFVQKVTISDKDTRVYYDANPNSFKRPEQVRARHILIKVDSKADESQKAAAHKKLENIRQKAGNGEDFEALAKEFSEGPSSAKGGDLGYFRRGQMVKPFEEAAFSLKPDEMSDIVETSFGYHLIKLIDKKPESTIAYEDIKDRLQEHLKQNKVREQVNLYVEDLRGKAKVERFLKENPQ